ncbi:unnamed protein product [Closterium sp. NIES-64]|nr:unnamed protein product [Closterium sp. NIES-64]
MALSLRQKQIGRSSPARYWNLSLRLSASLPLCLAASLPHCLLYPFHPLLFFFPCSPLRTPPSSPNLTPPSSPNLTPPWHRSSPLHRTAPHPSIAPLLTPPSHHSSPLRPTVRPCGPDAFVRTSISTAPPHASLLLAYAYPFNSHSPFLIPLDPTVRPCAPPDAIVRMLNLNSPVTVTVGGGLASDGDVYKVLLLDKYSRDLISPLLKSLSLILDVPTAHHFLPCSPFSTLLFPSPTLLSLPNPPVSPPTLFPLPHPPFSLPHPPLSPSSPLPAVYFLQPTAGNMQRLVLDATRGTYDKMHLNFTSSVPRLLLEDLAARQWALASRPAAAVASGVGGAGGGRAEPGQGAALSPVLKGAGGGGGAKATSYELDDSDSFWVAHSESPFPKAAEAVDMLLYKWKHDKEHMNAATVDMLLKKWTQDKEQVNAASPTGDAFSEAEDEDVMGRTKQLSAAMSAVPQLMERKRVIDKHVTIGGTLLEEIKSRALDAYFSMEEDLLTRGSTDRAAMLDLLRKRGSKEDKLRLAIIYLMATDNASAGDVEAVEAALREQQVDLAALHYIKQVKRVNSSFAAVAAAGGGAGGVGGVGGSKDDLLDWAGRLAGQGLSRVTAGVKNLLAGGRQLQLTRAHSSRGSRGAVRDAIVFVIGGGNYMEYGGLQEMARKAGAGSGAAGVRTVVYGTTEMLAGSQFVEQLSELGRKMGYKAPPLPAESAGGAAGGGGGCWRP